MVLSHGTSLRTLLVTAAIALSSCLLYAQQPLCHIERYNEDDGVPSSHITQLLQDGQGFMWFSTWNGLCRYDGYTFQTFKPSVGDGCHMTTDHISNINLLPEGKILCTVDNDYYIFELSTYRFRDLTDQEKKDAKDNIHKNRQSRSILKGKSYSWTDSRKTPWTIHSDGTMTYFHDGHDVTFSHGQTFQTLSFAMSDMHNNLWVLDYSNIYKITIGQPTTRRLDIEPRSEVKCLFADSKGRYWVSTKEDKALRIYDSSTDRPLGLLAPDGSIRQGYTAFGAAVYSMYETADGTLWLGTKPDGIYRLQPATPQGYHVTHIDNLPCNDIYSITSDRHGRLWIATLGGGIFYTDNADAAMPRFMAPRHYPKECSRARHIHITPDNIMLIATSSGLLIAKIQQDADRMTFHRHQREADRAQSLSSSATTDIKQDRKGRVFIGTESGGINQITDADLLAGTLTFRHLSDQFHVQPNDIALSLSPTADGSLVATGSHLVTIIDSTGNGRVLDAGHFKESYRFSEAHPLHFPDGRWLFGVTDGAFITTTAQMLSKSPTPKVVLTCCTIQNGLSNWNAESLDTMTLSPHERSVTINFAALDYNAAERINYAFRLQPHEQWNYVGHVTSATLIDLEPGTYTFEVRSTNADGEWQDNIRQLTVIVTPTFFESVWGRLLILFLILGAIAIIVYTLLYIRRIKRKQRETLEAYLSLIEGGGGESTAGDSPQLQQIPFTSQPQQHTPQELDPTIRRIMDFIEKNIANSDASVGDMADAAAISRSGLQRKLRQTMGITPQDLLREARIKHACLLLTQTTRSVSEIAYACGFTDPKYFSRCFKQSTGQSPSEYKNSVS